MYCDVRNGTLGPMAANAAGACSKSAIQPLASTLADMVSDGVLLIEPNSLRILDANRAFAQKIGQPVHDVVGRRLSSLLRNVEVERLVESSAAFCAGDANCEFIAELIQHDGQTLPISVSMQGKEVDGQAVFIAAIRPIHDGHLGDKKLRAMLAMAQADPLTGLPNRGGLDQQLQKVASPSDAANQVFAVMFIDVDHFKSVNDRLGHPAGDLVLREVARRLRESVRPTDFVGRFGGDEFVVVADDIGDNHGAARLARRICNELRRPIRLRDCSVHEVSITVSVGVALQHPRRKRDELVAIADREMYRAKAAGRNRFSLRSELKQS